MDDIQINVKILEGKNVREKKKVNIIKLLIK